MSLNEKIAIYPGSFDPITNGHVDVIERASIMFDKIYVVIAVNSHKITLFSEKERVELASESLKHIHNVEVRATHSLTVDFARQVNANIIIRGIRAISDFEFEFQIALMNRKIEPDIHTIFLLPNEKYTYLNSSIVKELAKYNEDVSDFVPENVSKALIKKIQNK